MFFPSGVAFASGETWKRQRKLVLNFLRAFGVNRTSFEDKIALEAEHLNAEFRKHGGLQFNPSHLLANAVSNVICSVLFGRRYEYTDRKFQRLLHAIYRNVAIIGGSTGPLQMLPYIYLLKVIDVYSTPLVADPNPYPYTTLTLKTLDMIGNCQRPVFSLGVSQHAL